VGEATGRGDPVRFVDREGASIAFHGGAYSHF